MLERYDARRKIFMDRVLAATNAKTVARLFLEGVAEFAPDTSGRDPPGCLLVQSGLSCTDQAIPNTLAKYRADKERLLRERLERAANQLLYGARAVGISSSQNHRESIFTQ